MFFTVFISPFAVSICISLPYISLVVSHCSKFAIFTYWLLYLYPRQENQHVSKVQ